MTDEIRRIYLSAAERAAGVVLEIETREGSSPLEVPAGTPVGARLAVRDGADRLTVEICERSWGLDGEPQRWLSLRGGEVIGDQSFWGRAAEELVESRRAGVELWGSVYAEQREGKVVVTGLHRCAVGHREEISPDPQWGALLWHTPAGLLSSIAAFSDEDARLAKAIDRPLLAISHTTLSPATVAQIAFPVGARSLAAVVGLRSLLALDRRRRGSPLLLGRALAARVVYPSGEVAPVVHAPSLLPRELFDRAGFELDRRLGLARGAAAQRLRQVYDVLVQNARPRA